jgi:hypothetical protein
LAFRRELACQESRRDDERAALGSTQRTRSVAYLRDVLARLPTHPASRIAELLFHPWAADQIFPQRKQWDGRPNRDSINAPKWKCHQPSEPRGASTMKIRTIGIDSAKNVFQVHGVDEHDKAVLRKQLRRDQMATFFVNLPPCVIGIEACSSAHHWARKLVAMGHTVRLMAPQFVKPYVKTNKNDAGYVRQVAPV